MDRALNPKYEKQTIYEIYRACRLCGAGAGYKMPIIQNVVDLDGNGIELRQKIKECVQIEVSHTDRMPPLICELCVDKVNDFYEFYNLCKKTNERTRLRLGLPPQARARGSENCILGVTEPGHDDSVVESLRHRNKQSRVKKEVLDQVKIENEMRRVARMESVDASRNNVRKRQTIVEKGKEYSKVARPLGSVVSSREPSAEPRPASARQQGRRTRQHVPAEIDLTQLKLSPPPKPDPPTKSMKSIHKTEETQPEKKQLKRPREKETKDKDTPPPSKRLKLPPEPVKTSKPGPKSSKNLEKEQPEPPQPKAKPASKKETPLKPTPKTSKTPAPKAPTPKTPAPKTTVTKTPAPKTPVPKTSVSKTSVPKTSVSKTPVSKTPVSETPVSKTAVSKAPKSKPFYCKICNTQAKTSQGFAQHNTKHVPSYTSPKLACNACELWFVSAELANGHHREHRELNVPYKCTRCYGYFKLQLEYDDHFAEQRCLSVYEVPDVACWQCGDTFPTDLLLRGHRCRGEGARRGGKCGNCDRSYALHKNLIKHEATCTYKKKGEVAIEPSVQARLLPMQVRISRCDALLSGPHALVSRVPQNYGLDRKCRYPYLPPETHGKRKPSTKPHRMLSITDDVRKELKDTDSEASNDSQSVDSLSAMSLKTILSRQGLDTPPINVKPEFDDLSKKIDSILDNLGNDELSCDSDSILDRKVQKVSDGKEDSQTSCDSDSIIDRKSSHVKENSDKNYGSVEKLDADDKLDGTREKLHGTGEKLDEIREKLDRIGEKLDDAGDKPSKKEKLDGAADKLYSAADILDSAADKLDSAGEKMEVDNDKEVSVKNTDASSLKSDVIEDKYAKNNENMDVTTEKVDGVEEMDVSDEKIDDTLKTMVDTDETMEDDTEKANLSDKNYTTSDKLNFESDKTSMSSEIEGTSIENVDGSTKERENDSTFTKEYDLASNDDPKSIVHNDDSNSDTKINVENLHNDVKKSQNVNSDDFGNISDVETSQNHEENESNKLEVSKDNSDVVNPLREDDRLVSDVTKNDDIDSINQSVQSNSNEKLDSNENNDTNESVENNHDSEKSESEDSFTKIDKITNEILKHSELQQKNDCKNNDSEIPKSEHSDSISLNSVKSDLNGVEMRDKFNVDDLSDEDRRLMAELDAQIGDDDPHDQRTSDNEQKLSQNHLKPSDNDQKLGENDLKLSENDHKVDKNQKLGQNDERYNESEKKTYENDQHGTEIDRIHNEHQKFTENDQSFIQNDHKPEKNDQKSDNNDQKFVQNDQIISQNDIVNERRENEKKKSHYIDDLLRKQDSDMRAMDLDSISDDEFNFDA